MRESLRRAAALTSDDRILVVARAPRRALDGSMDAGLPGRLLVEPCDRGTAASVLLALAHILEEGRHAIVLLLPAAHLADPEGRILGWLAEGIGLAARTGRIVRFEAGAKRASAHGRPASPDRPAWRPSGILAAPAERMWEMAWRMLPDMARSFDMVRHVLRSIANQGATREHLDLVLAHVYGYAHDTDFNWERWAAAEPMLVVTLNGCAGERAIHHPGVAGARPGVRTIGGGG